MFIVFSDGLEWLANGWRMIQNGNDLFNDGLER